MGYQLAPIVLLFAGSSVLAAALAYAVYRISGDRLGMAFLVWSTGSAVWSLTIAFRLAATTQASELLWYRVRFLGVTVATIGFFLFTAAYTVRYQWFRRRRLAVLSVIPVVTNLFAWTNGADGLLWSVAGSEGLLVAVPEPGPWFTVHAVWAYLLIVTGFAWLFLSLFQNRRVLYQGQTALILTGVVVGILPSVLSVVGETTVTWTPVGNTVAAIALGSAVLRYQAFDISPIARDVVIENIDRGMLVIDDGDRVVDANEYIEPILDASPADLLGESLDAVMRDIVGESVWQSVDDGNTETVTISVDGESRAFELSTSPIFDSTDTRIGRVILFSDVTEKRRRQRQLQAQTAKLERQNQQLDKFASVISHDLRNPLGVAQLRLELLDEENEHTEAIEESLDRMETMIHDVLTMARASETVEEGETERIQLRKLAAEAWSTTESGSATVELDVPDGLVIEGHWSLLRTVFENLFRNALDHNDPPVTVRVSAETDDAGTVERFCIEDDGAGIPDDQRDRIFEYGHTTSEEGTGFGLAIVREIVQAHGWDITVSEGTDGGARFDIHTDDGLPHSRTDRSGESKPTSKPTSKPGQ